MAKSFHPIVNVMYLNELTIAYSSHSETLLNYIFERLKFHLAAREKQIQQELLDGVKKAFDDSNDDFFRLAREMIEAC